MTERAPEPYAIDWVDLGRVPSLGDAAAAGGALGMSHAPGVTDPVKQRDRDVATDVARLHDVERADAVLLLLGDDELPLLEISELPDALDDAGIELLRHPIPDVGVPADREAFGAVAADVVARVRSGQRVVVACRAGFGRTGTVTATILRQAGLDAADAVELVRTTRPGTIERDVQLDFVEGWSA
jgi:hypothetical protein